MFQFKEKYKNRVFKDIHLHEQLEDFGFVVVPFYSLDEVALLRSFYYEHTKSNQGGFLPTTYFDSLEYRIKASNYIKDIAQRPLEQYMQHYKTFMGSYIVKHNDKKSELGVHQDMSLVDESNYMGMNVWAPLCDTTVYNGALYLIPKSHRIFPTYRNATIKNIYDKYFHTIKKYMQPIYMKAGQAIIFDNSILHYSPINTSKEIRIATNVFVTHNDANVTICYHDKVVNRIELFEQKDDFFTTYTQFGNDSNQQKPKIGSSLGFVEYDFPDLTPKKLKELYGNPPKMRWIERVFKKLI